jgi:methionyl-tRNA formyltransferase
MHGKRTIGITLQTMDERAFDKGQILVQEEIQLPFAQAPSYEQLLSFIQPFAANILTQGLRNRVFVPPLPRVLVRTPRMLIHAGKITSADREIVLSSPAVQIERQFRALGRLWCDLCNDAATLSKTQRVIFEDCEIVSTPPLLSQWIRDAEIAPYLQPIPRYTDSQARFFAQRRTGTDIFMAQPYTVAEDGESIILACLQGTNLSLRIKEITVAGKATLPAARAIRAFDGTEAWDIIKVRRKLMVQPKSRRAFEGSGRIGPCNK